MIAKRRAAGETILMLGQVHNELPYMPGDAELAIDTFDLLIDEPSNAGCSPRRTCRWAFQDHFIGLHASTLVRDGGTLQIGIGAMGDACRRIAGTPGRQRRLPGGARGAGCRPVAGADRARRGLDTFAQGLYGCSEMFVNGLLVLAEAGVVRRPADEQGVLVHGGFFLGPQAFYQRLRECRWRSARSSMTRISYINELYGQEALKRRSAAMRASSTPRSA
jgi:acyl-CoA hydrolase